MDLHVLCELRLFWCKASSDVVGNKAISLLGCVSVAVNAWSPLDPLVFCLKKTRPKVVLIDNERARLLQPRFDDVKAAGIKAILVTRATQSIPGTIAFSSWLASGYSYTALPNVAIEPEDNATIFFTSGTTGLPKGVLSTQRQYISNLFNSVIGGARAALRAGMDIPVIDPAAPQRGTLLSIPLFHATGNQSFLQGVTYWGSKIVLMRKWDVREAVKLIKREKLTGAGGVPTMVAQLVDADLGDDTTLMGFSFGGAPPSSSMPKNARKRLPKIPLSQGYGLTETNAVATSIVGEDYVQR